jgi:uncharacterized protein YbaP (TraB family)
MAEGGLLRKVCAIGASWLLLAQGLAAEVPADADSPEVENTAVEEATMDVVLVRGFVAGPALWKVSSGDNVMWIVGEISPYPRTVKWRSKEFEKLLRSSQELLLDFSGYWWVDDDNSAALNKAVKLPDGKKLKDVISPELHARAESAAKLFGNPALEEMRPFAATNRLVTSAMKTLELESFSARFTAAKLGKWRKKKVTYFAAPEVPFEERLKNWEAPTNEVCLKRLVDAIEDGGDGVKLLANAWAVGDIKALRELVPAYSFSRDGFRSGECAAAMHGGEQKARDYKASRNQAWLAEAERALTKNRSTMAVVLMSELFEPDGYLAALRAKGYTIVEPH